MPEYMVTNPITRIGAISYAKKIRDMLGVDTLFFPVMEFLDRLPEMLPGFSYEIVEDEALEKEQHAITIPELKTIIIKQTIFERASNGEGRDRMTIMHEVAHYLWLVVNCFSVARTLSDKKPEAYKDPEWQAKCLAAELMMPFAETYSMSAKDICVKCGVSLDGATTQKKLSHTQSNYAAYVNMYNIP